MSHVAWYFSSLPIPSKGTDFGKSFPPFGDRALAFGISAVIGVLVFLKLSGFIPAQPDVAGSTAGIQIMPVSQPFAETRIQVPPAAIVDAVVAPPPANVLPAPPAASVAPPASRSSDPAPAQAAPPPARASIRDIDILRLPAVINLATQIGGTVNATAVTYGNVTGAGEVAIVPIHSGGSAGHVAVAVVGVGREGPQVFSLLTPDSTSRGGIRVAVEDGRLVSTSAVFGPEDALCCPSSLRGVYYVWDGAKLQIERQSTTPSAPSAKN